jgi:hypothetical protein
MSSDDSPTPDHDSDATQTWPDLAISLYDRLTGRNAEITYEFDDMEVDVPDRAGPDPEFAHWRLNGTLRIRTQEREE